MLFSVFTAVYNRRDLIHRVWDSLQQQTDRDFEWVVVDDGSTDNIVELIEQYTRQADFPITFRTQTNGGKHKAWNTGIPLCKGELVVPVDSDDAFIPTALQRFRELWLGIPEAERKGYSGINVLCADPQTKQVIGMQFPSSPMVSNNLEIEYIHKVRGGKWGCIRADLLRENLLPSGPGLEGNYISENLIWYGLARNYKALYVNEPLHLYYHDDPASYTLVNAKIGLKGRLRRPVGPLYYYKNWHLNQNFDYLWHDKKELLKTVTDLWFCGFATHRSVFRVLRDAKFGWPLVWRLAGFPSGLATYLYVKAAQPKSKK